MPCRSDHMEPTSRDVYYSQVLCLHDELSGKDFPHKYWNGYHPRVYGLRIPDREVDEVVAHLCSRLGKSTPENIQKYSLELQIWWRDHQAADKRRAEAGLENAKNDQRRKAALAKLTPEDREALGL